MDIRDLPICPECGANIKSGNVCVNCGYVIKLELEKEENESGESSGGSQFLPNSYINNEKVTSLFDKLVPEGFDLLSNRSQENKKIVPSNKYKLATTIFLILILLFAFSSSVYAFWLKKEPYIEPVKVVTSTNTADIQKEIDNLQLSSSGNVQKTLDIKSDLKEGNFDKYDFSIFADPNVNLMFEAFDFRHFLKNVINKENILDQIKKDTEMSDDDFDVYLSKEFSFIFPDNNFEKWGIVLVYKDEKFISTKLEKIKKIRESSKKNFYTNYSIEAVKYKDDKFILISNSKVFLDQMKEMAEGNVQNLSKSAVYIDSLKDMPKLGYLFVYKKQNSETWNYFIENAISKYKNLESAEVLLRSISPSVLVFSDDNDKTRITY